jgi:peptide/nickel transport system permease protein
MEENQSESYWTRVWTQFRYSRTGSIALAVTVLFGLLGLFAPFLASSKPLVIIYNDTTFFPLFRYLLQPGFFTKRIDLFYNLLMFTLPAWLLLRRMGPTRSLALPVSIGVQFIGFIAIVMFPPMDPASDPSLNLARQNAIHEGKESLTWTEELSYLTPYAKLNLVLRDSQRELQHQRLQRYRTAYLEKRGLAYGELPTLWQIQSDHEKAEVVRHETVMQKEASGDARADRDYVVDRRAWLEQEKVKLGFQIPALVRQFHWEDDAGGEQDVNQFVDWYELTRINRKDLFAGLIFGVRISLMVGVTAISLALLIGVPVGAAAGFYGGRFDMLLMRLIEVWESMPSLFMLLMVIGITQSKSIFLVIGVIAVFGWTGFSRFIRGEFLKQRNLPYVEACQAMGFRNSYTIFVHILPNAIPPLLTLVPFAVMGAITSEAGLSFLGLGEEGSCSWGVLMDEGRTAFPGESYLLWPPAIMLTVLLVAIALVGDALRDALDPKMRKG